MSSPTVCTCSCPDGDSALSTTANIISILTFAYVLIIGGLYQIASYQRANYDFSGLRQRAVQLQTEAREIQRLYKEHAHMLPGVDVWNLTGIAIKTTADLSRDLERAERKASSKWYLVWQEVTFRSAKERRAWEQELDNAEVSLRLDRMFIENTMKSGPRELLSAQGFAAFKLRPEDVKRLRTLMSGIHSLRRERMISMQKRPDWLKKGKPGSAKGVLATYGEYFTQLIQLAQLTQELEQFYNGVLKRAQDELVEGRDSMNDDSEQTGVNDALNVQSTISSNTSDHEVAGPQPVTKGDDINPTIT